MNFLLGPMDIPVSVTDEFILWYRSGPLHSIQEITTVASSTDILFTETTDTVSTNSNNV